jgi:hypothetical protein
MLQSIEIVPPELLARPFRDEARRLDHDLCALQLDPYLRRLASQEARCRRVLGTIGREFLRRQAHHTLGFARVNDYARERLGISGRELQSTASVVRALADLPACAAAFERGALSWTQLRMLTAVAQPENEEAWLALAAGRTVRALEAAIRSARAPAQSNSGASTAPVASRAVDDALDECDEDGHLVDGEREVTFRVRCPRWVLPLWRDAVELARRVAGEPLPVWRAAEAIAAEGLGSPEAHARQHPGGNLDNTTPVPSATREPADPEETRAAFMARSGLDAIDWSSIVEALPDDVECLVRDVEASDAHELDDRMRAALHALHQIDWQLGRLLRLFQDCRLYLLFGFTSWNRYVRERLGIATRSARLLVALERKTWESPALMDAYRRGALSAVRALTIAPVIGERHGEAWVARAAEVTVRRLADEVDWALDVRDASIGWVSVAPPATGTSLVAPPRQMRAPLDETVDAEIVVRGPASVIALVRDAVAAFHKPLTPTWIGFVALIQHATAEWNRLPRHRDPVFARDGWRCAVPACGSRRNLHDHHIIYRSRGGDNARDNRVSVCAAHHLHGVHVGRMRAWGVAPDRIHWELGVRRDRPPLLRLVGERYEPSTPQTRSLRRLQP